MDCGLSPNCSFSFQHWWRFYICSRIWSMPFWWRCFELFFICVLPAGVTTTASIILNVYTDLQADKRLSGNSGQSVKNKISRFNLSNLKEHSNPIITLLVIVQGGLAYNITMALLYYLVKLVINSAAYYNLMIIAPNVNYVCSTTSASRLFMEIHFKQTREPMGRIFVASSS